MSHCESVAAVGHPLVATPPAATSRFVLAWAHGHNLGHLARLGAVSDLIASAGNELVWALPPAHRSASAFAAQGRWRGARLHLVPPPVVEVDRQTRPHSFADVLASFGFTNEAALRHNVGSWLKVFSDSSADAVVLDYAPAAQLAALVAGLPAAQITNGFDAPPPHCPVFGIDVRGPMLDRRNAQQVERVNHTIDRVARSLGRAAGSSLEALLRYPTRWYDCAEEADPYGPRADGVYVGPTGRPDQTQQVEWPEGDAAAPKLFVYLRNEAQVGAVLDALGRIDARVICAWPGAAPEALQRLRGPGRVVVGGAVDLSTVLPACDAVVNYGSTTLVNQTLLAGKPQLMLPTDAEKWLVANRVVAQGAGLMRRWPVAGDALAAALHGLLHDAILRDRTRGICTRQVGLAARLPGEVTRFVSGVKLRATTFGAAGGTAPHELNATTQPCRIGRVVPTKNSTEGLAKC